jgi:hypothetical protein
MEIHLAIPNYGPGSTPAAITEIAEEAEALGFDGVASTDHLLVPRGQPERYERIFEALAVLAYLAGRTRRVKLITSVVVVLMRNPFAVAKQPAEHDVPAPTCDSFGVARGQRLDRVDIAGDAEQLARQRASTWHSVILP